MSPKKIINYIRYFVLKTGNFSFINKVYLLFYKISLIFIIRGLRKLKTIKAIWLEGSLIQEKSRPKAGSTDIDLLIITEELSIKEELNFIYAYIKKCVNLKKIFPFLKDHSALNKSTARIHSYTKILGPYHFKKYDRLYKVVAGSSTDGHSPKKLNFNLESYPIDDFFILARTALRPINEDLYNVATENWAYTRNTINSIARIIEYINKNIPNFKSQSLTNELRKKITFFTNKNFFAYSTDLLSFTSLINDSYALLGECLNHLLTTTQGLDTPVEKKISLTRYNLPNKNLAYIAAKMKDKITSLYNSKTNILHNISILPDHNCNNRFVPYIIFNNGLDPKTIKNIYTVLKEIDIAPPEFGCIAGPIVLTKKMFYLNKKYIEACRGPLDLFLFNKLIYTIVGDVLNTGIDEETIHNFLNTKLYGNISKVDYNYIIGSHNVFEQLVEYLQNKNIPAVMKTTYYLLESITSHRLAVEKGVIASTPLEAFNEYLGHYSDEELTGWYDYFYHKLHGIKASFLTEFIESEIKELFRFYRQNRNLINDTVSSRLKSHFGGSLI